MCPCVHVVSMTQCAMRVFVYLGPKQVFSMVPMYYAKWNLRICVIWAYVVYVDFQQWFESFGLFDCYLLIFCIHELFGCVNCELGMFFLYEGLEVSTNVAISQSICILVAPVCAQTLCVATYMGTM